MIDISTIVKSINKETDLTALQELLVGIFKIPWEE